MSQTIQRVLITPLEKIGIHPESRGDEGLKKSVLLISAVMMASFGIVWGIIYYIYGEHLAAYIPLSYSGISFLSIIIFILTRRYQVFRFSQLLLSLLLPFLLMVALGRFDNSSAVILWSFTSPLGAILFANRRKARWWFAAFISLVLLSGVLESTLRLENNLPTGLITFFFVLNIFGVSTVAFIMLQYFVSQKDTAMQLLRTEQEKSERLLLNVLPEEIAPLLKEENEHTIAKQFDSVSVLFADVVGFTALSEKLSPTEMVEVLNEVFSYFDSLVKKYGLEKIRTIGDNYMVVAGAPRSRPDHAQALARMALEMPDFIHHCSLSASRHLQFRIGINSGPAVGGVIGDTKFHYDLWGDAVNIASRMESHGVPGKVQIGPRTHELIQYEFVCIPRGTIAVKGKGEMKTWFLEGAPA